MSIRKSTLKDIPQLIGIVQGVKSVEDFAGEYSHKMFRDMLNRKNNIFFVEENNNKVRGFIACYVNKQGKRIYLDTIAVAKDQRGKGIANNLTEFIEKWAKDNKMKSIYFNVRDWNRPMNKLAKKRKYKLKERFFLWEKKL